MSNVLNEYAKAKAGGKATQGMASDVPDSFNVSGLSREPIFAKEKEDNLIEKLEREEKEYTQEIVRTLQKQNRKLSAILWTIVTFLLLMSMLSFYVIKARPEKLVQWLPERLGVGYLAVQQFYSTPLERGETRYLKTTSTCNGKVKSINYDKLMQR